MTDQIVSQSKTMQTNLVAGEKSTLTRERSFVRTPQQIKRRSLAFQQIEHQQMRSKPAIEIYRPPSKNLRVYLRIFFMIFVFFQKFALMDQHLSSM